MRRRIRFAMIAALLAVTVGGCSPASDAPDGWTSSAEWVKPTATALDPADFVVGVDHPHWPLLPGTIWRYEAITPDGVETIEVKVLDESREVMGIECVVVRDTVTLDGVLIEDTFDWYAQDTLGNVWYMGEDVKNYENGRLVDSAGSWEAGVAGALPGIKLWAAPRIGGAPYYQEFYQGEAEDLARDLRADGTATVAGTEYAGLLVVEEWTPLDPTYVERKYYAEGIGTVMEEMTRGGEERVELVEFVLP